MRRGHAPQAIQHFDLIRASLRQKAVTLLNGALQLAGILEDGADETECGQEDHGKSLLFPGGLVLTNRETISLYAALRYGAQAM